MGVAMERPREPNRNETSAVYWRYVVWMVVVLLISFFWVSLLQDSPVQALSYSQFKEQVKQGEVAQVTIEGQAITGRYVAKSESPNPEGAPAPGRTTPDFETVMPPFGDPELMPLLEAANVTVFADHADSPWWAQMLMGLLPWILIIGLIFYAMRKMSQRVTGQAGDNVFGFGKSKARRFREGTTNVSFSEVAGLENAKQDLKEIIDYLRAPERFRAIGAKIPKGILLMGPPGTGKTLLAKAVAGEAHAPFYSISGSEFIEMFVGVGAARVRDLFESAKKEAPSIIFIDEIDSVGRARGTGLGGGHDEREQTLNQILSEMDGFAPHEAVVVMAATNRPDVLDKALMRPGRFDRKVTLDLPRREARRHILEVHTRNVPLADDIDLDVLSSRTVGFSGADLENLVNEAALLAGRDHKQKVDMTSMNRARDKIILGAEREGMLNEEEKRIVAYHEAGHAVMAWVLPHADPLDKVTIIPRGMALGATEQMPEEERQNLSRSYLLDRIAVMLGGRVSEKLVFAEFSSGAESDLRQATQLSRRMICQWGMSERLGPVSFPRGEEHVFLGREIAQQRDFSEHTARLIDEEVRSMIVGLEERTEHLLTEHRAKLDALAAALIKSETLEYPDVERLFATL